MKGVIIPVVFIFFMVNACNSNKFDVDISNIKVDLNIKRLDLDLMHNYPDTPDVYKLINDYGSFLELYGYQVLQIGGVNEREFGKLLLDFNKYCQDFNIPTKIEQQFGNFSETKIKLETALKYYKYYFPEKSLPQVYAYYSNFSQSIITDVGLVGIGLDKYLGADCELYSRLGFDNYKVRRMHKEMLPVDFMRALALSEFPYHDSTDNLLNQIVYEGKIQYFLDAMLPNIADSLKFAYTKDQMDWAMHNEGEMWAYLIDSQTLFTTDALIIRKMIGDGPFTSLFANNSAPRAGAFLGWKIVHNYMEYNSEVSLPQLMSDSDYQGILNKARYKP
ncbi:MAG: hypothetical protein P1P88_03885 [Bacteroidales bacterium]|nr:hypothetical protein [Bacteroidales bacterium]